jgi:CBS domain-containing protein
MQVKDLMSSVVYTCSARDTLDVPARIMWEHDVGFVPVVDDQHHLEGVVTDRDSASL